MTEPTRLVDLLSIMEWADLRNSPFMTDLRMGKYRGDGKTVSLEGYRIAFEKIRRLEPMLSEWTLVFSEPMDVSGRPPAGDPAFDEPGASESTLFALDGTPWLEFLGMKIDTIALETFDWPSLAAICIWEMTFYGWTERQTDGFFAESKTEYSWRHRLFISHASEDKDELVRPLAAGLQALGLRVWLDEIEMSWGDSLRRRLDEALAKCDYGLLILSPSFFGKPWPAYELDALVARALDRQRFILPIWHRVTREDVLNFSPNLADKLAIRTDDFENIESLGLKIHEELFFENRTDESKGHDREIRS